MKKEVKIDVNIKDYFEKMSPEDSAFITTMCLDKLCTKAQELKDLYMKLAKTYGIEMGLMDITCIVQISSPKLSPFVPVQGFLGTVDGIKNGLAALTATGIKELARMKKEEVCNNDKEQD